MSLRKITPCDYSGGCPYNAGNAGSCEYWCGDPEPAENFWEEIEDYEKELDHAPAYINTSGVGAT